jgi:hypothetical protein
METRGTSPLVNDLEPSHDRALGKRQLGDRTRRDGNAEASQPALGVELRGVVREKTAMISMDEKAANPGDQLKHPLSLEVLARCSSWEKVTYAETHGGAGRYFSSGQALEAPQIHRLRDQVRREPGAVDQPSAGSGYL